MTITEARGLEIVAQIFAFKQHVMVDMPLSKLWLMLTSCQAMCFHPEISPELRVQLLEVCEVLSFIAVDCVPESELLIEAGWEREHD